MIVAPRQDEQPVGVRAARPPTVSIDRATVGGGIYVPAELAAQAHRASRILAKPNPEYTQWLKRCSRAGKQVGQAPTDQYVAAGLLFDGPWAGGWWLPRHSPVKVLELADATVFPAAEALELQVELRPFQQAAIDAWLWEQSGTVIAPCGAGKTTIGAAAIASLKTPALVLVHTLDLVEQWRARCASQLGAEAGIIGDGQVDIDGRRVVVGTIQTLASWTWSERFELGQKFGLVILDEAHHAPARTFAEVMAALPGRYRLGLTATPKRRDGLDDILWWTCGREVYRVEQRHLEALGYTMTPEITWVPTSFVPRSSADDWTELMDELAKDAARNQILVRGICSQARAGRCVLVLADRVSHCEALAEAVRAGGVPAQALTGRLTKKKRGELLQDVLTGALPVVTATSLADEGLDLAVVDCIVLAAPSRNEARVQQRVGRALRPWDGKPQPLVFDLVDPFGVARGMARKRRQLYARLGWSPPPLPPAGGAS